MPLHLGKAWRKTTLPGDRAEQGRNRGKAGLGVGAQRRKMRSFLSVHMSSEEGALGAPLACQEGHGSWQGAGIQHPPGPGPGARQPGVFLQGERAIFSLLSWPLHNGRVCHGAA